MADLKRLVESYLKSSYRTTPVRSPFSQTNYYTGGRVSGGSGSWMDLTELYNTTYRTHYEEDGFDKVLYNEPLNIMVTWPKDDAEAFSQIDEDCVATFGLKTARGFKKDYRFTDMSIPGAGRVAMSEEQANGIVEDPFDSLREVRPAYTRNLGETPIERIDESEEKDEEEDEEQNIRLAIQRKMSELVHSELEEVLSGRRNFEINLTEEENGLARRALRYRQLHEDDMSRLENVTIDVLARRLRENEVVTLSPEERNALQRAVSRVPEDNSINEKLQRDA